MSDKTRKIVLLGILALTTIWGYNNFSNPAPATEGTPAKSTSATQALTIDASARLPESIVKTLSDKPWGDDPFYDRTTRRTQTATPLEPKLQAIFYNDVSSSAYIDGRLVRVGDKIGDSEVSEIGPDSVKLERDGKTITLIIKTG
ncbi:MAG: hypothetical protein IIB00_06605 [candidate division Zixibacteria bacterium]|nr:hypothetical protein [candidate division Zixibacteria bacterium]